MINKNNHLPIFGVGPIYVIIIIAITIVAVIFKDSIFLEFGKIYNAKPIFIALGIICVILGIVLFYFANFKSKIDKNIKNNNLVTSGVYKFVRNPIYSAYLSLCTGIILFCQNIALLVLPIVYWLFLTILMINTEEKWLTSLYGEKYKEYCKKVNRCIPMIPKK